MKGCCAVNVVFHICQMLCNMLICYKGYPFVSICKPTNRYLIALLRFSLPLLSLSPLSNARKLGVSAPMHVMGSTKIFSFT